MKLKELNEAIAAACSVRPNIVSSVQTETFKQLRAALDKGERVVIPDFGIFLVRESAGEDGAPAKKSIKFRLRDEEDTVAKKERRKEKKAAKESKPESKTDGED